MPFYKFVLASALLLASGFAVALDVKPYSAEELETSQSAGKPVAVHFHAGWCPTCRVQAQALDSLKSDKSLDLTVLVANYDAEKELKKRLGVRVQSTFVVFKGKKETARLAGDTAEAKIRAALQTAL